MLNLPELVTILSSICGGVFYLAYAIGQLKKALEPLVSIPERVARIEARVDMLREETSKHKLNGRL